MTLSRGQWAKTPYARSSAGNPDGAIQSLLAKYGVRDVQWTTGAGPNGRRACQLRFVYRQKGYRIFLECLDADASEDELLRQVKRAVYYYLKSLLEMAGVFFSAEELLYAYLELPSGATMYAASKPYVDRLSGPDFGKLLALPAAD
jgi:hypothetical protein